MVRKLEVVVPSKHSAEIRNVLMTNRSVHHLSYRECKTPTDGYIGSGLQSESTIFSFNVVNKKTQELVDLLTMYGVSSRFGYLNVFPLSSTKPRVATIKETNPQMKSDDAFSSMALITKKRNYKISDRLAYDEIRDWIDSQMHLTFDYLALAASGGIIAGCGLLTNSPVVVVASMLVSPLMGPIVGMTFGAIIKDKTMTWTSFWNELIGILVCWLSGAFMGFICAPLMDDPENDQLVGINTQISSRGDWVGLGWGAGIAAPSGVAVAIGVTSDTVMAIIGVAISAALLPPIVNSGVCLAASFVYFVDPKYTAEIAWHWFEMGCVSMLLFIINWVLIFIFGIMAFRCKNLHSSANDQAKMEQLNRFYAMREKVKEEHPSVSFGNDNAFGGKSPMSEQLNTTPLLITKSTSYGKEDVKLKHSKEINDSLDGISTVDVKTIHRSSADMLNSSMNVSTHSLKRRAI